MGGISRLTLFLVGGIRRLMPFLGEVDVVKASPQDTSYRVCRAG
jgi:hypothetical protein